MIFLHKKGMMDGMYLLLILGFIVWTVLVIALTCLAVWRPTRDDSRELRSQFFYSKSGEEE